MTSLAIFAHLCWLLPGRPLNMGLSTGFIFAFLCYLPVFRPSVLSIIVLGILKQSVQSDVGFALKLHVVHHQLCVPEARQQPVSYRNPRFPHHLSSWLAPPLFFPISVSITPIPSVQAKNPAETHLGFSHFPSFPSCHLWAGPARWLCC